MAHTTRTPARIQRLTSLAAIVAVAVAIAVAFGRVFAGRRRHGQAAGGRCRVGAGRVGARAAQPAAGHPRRGRSPARRSSGSIVFRDTTWNLLPGLETLRAIGSAAAAVGEQARVQVGPCPAGDPAGVRIGRGGVGGGVLVPRARVPRGEPAPGPRSAGGAWSSSSTRVLEDDVRALYGIVFLLAALAVLFADSLRRMQGWGPVWNGPGRSDRLIPGAGRNARVVVSAVARRRGRDAVPRCPGSAAAPRSTSRSGAARAMSTVSTLVSMAAQLTQGEPHDVFEVQTDVRSYYRMIALDQFDGVTWTPRENFSTEVVAGTPLAASDAGRSVPRSPRRSFTFVADQTFPVAPDDLPTDLARRSRAVRRGIR